jgi:hypothetical protein
MKNRPWRYRSPKPAQTQPSLRFTSYAWAKLTFLRDLGTTEVGAFGISAESDLLLVEDVQLVQQVCTAVTVAFDDSAVADFFDDQVDRQLSPERFGRIWIHTHPGRSPEPSFTDEETFERSFSAPAWALMFILARGGQSYARIRFQAGPGGQVILPVRVDYKRPFVGSDHDAWRHEYDRCVRRVEEVHTARLLDRRFSESADSLDQLLTGLGAPWW